MPDVLTRIKPMHGPIVPQENWRMAGMTPDGRQLFTEHFRMNKAVPDYEGMTTEEILKAMEIKDPVARAKVLDPSKRRWRKHPLNAEPLVPMNRRRDVDVERTFYVISQGNFNCEKQFYTPPTEAEIQAAQREGRIESVLRKLAEGLVDKGSHLTDDQLVARMLSGGAVLESREAYEKQFAEPGQDVVIDDTKYPLDIGKGKMKGKKWRLSNGTEIEGTEDEAVAFELQIIEVREASQANEF